MVPSCPHSGPLWEQLCRAPPPPTWLPLPQSVYKVLNEISIPRQDQHTSSSFTFGPFFFVRMYLSKSLRVFASTLTWQRKTTLYYIYVIQASKYYSLTTRAFSPSFKPSNSRMALRVDSGRAYSQKPNAGVDTRKREYYCNVLIQALGSLFTLQFARGILYSFPALNLSTPLYSTKYMWSHVILTREFNVLQPTYK